MDMDEALRCAKADLVDKLINDPFWAPYNRLAKHLRRCREVMDGLESTMLAAQDPEEAKLAAAHFLSSQPDFYQL